MRNSGSGVESGNRSQTEDYPDTGKAQVTAADTGTLMETGLGQVTGAQEHRFLWEKNLGQM